MAQPYKYGKSKSVRYHARHQDDLIRSDIDQLLKKESSNMLLHEDIKKFRLLLAREPVIKKDNNIK